MNGVSDDGWSELIRYLIFKFRVIINLIIYNKFI